MPSDETSSSRLHHCRQWETEVKATDTCSRLRPVGRDQRPCHVSCSSCPASPRLSKTSSVALFSVMTRSESQCCFPIVWCWCWCRPSHHDPCQVRLVNRPRRWSTNFVYGSFCFRQEWFCAGRAQDMVAESVISALAGACQVPRNVTISLRREKGTLADIDRCRHVHPPSLCSPCYILDISRRVACWRKRE